MEKSTFLKKASAIAMAGMMTVSVGQMSIFAETTNSDVNAKDYTYVFAGLTWDEYWKSEDVYVADNKWTATSDVLDSHNEYDKGAFDVVSRATTNHGLHRGSFQCSTDIVATDADGNEKIFTISYWTKEDNKTVLVLKDGSKITDYAKGKFTYNNVAYTMAHYYVKGMKYIPVAVKNDDLADFESKYTVIKSGEAVEGGYSEGVLSSYSLKANLDENTNGLKYAEKNTDGTYSFSQRNVGTTSGIEGADLQKAENVNIEVKDGDDVGSYGEYIRVDFKGDGYGALGSKMYAVRWDYYGDDNSYNNKLVSFGTKFASDNWMHKVMGIQLGLTDSYRFKLPENTDGTGYWKLTIYALGYEDYTVNFQITADNLPAQSTDELDKTELQKLVDQANALNENDYTVDSWKDLKTELDESVDLLANARNQASINEQVKHLTLAINSLVKKEVPTETTPTETTPTETTPTTTTPITTKPSTTTPTKPLVKKTTVSLARTNGSVYVKGRTTVKATIKNGKGKTTYKSNNTGVAKVSSNGVVTGVKKGTAVITVTNNRVSRTFKVTVKNPTLNRTTLNLKAKKNYTLKVQGKIGKVTFKSSNTKVASVNAKGKVVAKKKGNATITVKANGITLKCKVKVK